jgi:uncharacterized membrane protein
VPSSSKTFAHILHDVGLATWFGGSLMGVVGLNGAASKAADAKERTPIADAGWDRWTPVNFAGIAAHLVGATLLTTGNLHRIAGQKGVATTATVKAGLTVAALAATAYGRRLGNQIKEAGPVVADGPTDPSPETPEPVAAAMRREKVVQWAIPAVTGAMMAVSAYMSDQQRPAKVAKGVLARLTPDALAA